MCGIFGIISKNFINYNHLKSLAAHASRRGRDSSGIMHHDKGIYMISRADYGVRRVISKMHDVNSKFVIGHSRLITNGLTDNQPVVRDGIVVIHNGIIVNEKEIWESLPITRELLVDTEVIAALTKNYLDNGNSIEDLPQHLLKECKGTISSAIAIPYLGKLCLVSNNGSLHIGGLGEDLYFSSESYPLKKIGCDKIDQICNSGLIVNIPIGNIDKINDESFRNEDLIPVFKNISAEEEFLIYPKYDLKRCKTCILPETMPHIRFSGDGECNYCKNYKTRTRVRPIEELLKVVEPHRRKNGPECIVPFSGGRDSCWGLHIIVEELKLKPITYTYDWGMVTDLGRRNISRMCSKLGVENIIIADDISKKRRNIAKNLKAWLKSPNLGMVSILTAGDKHFFRHVETVKQESGVSLNLWGINPLEVTHFKAGFLGVPPDFEEKRVYTHGWSKQLNYQRLRFKAMLQSVGYFNTSIFDTLTGEYYRSFTEKTDYYHLFDYWRWDENVCNDVLTKYDWELAPDTNTTWRIGDGTAAFYNYIYYTAVGFTEHDTFRSNQIREGMISRDRALLLVEDENRPRYQNIRWYLDAIGVDFYDTIKVINTMKRQ